MSSQNNCVLHGKERRSEQVNERRGERERAKEAVWSEGEGDDGKMSQMLLVHKEAASAQSSVAGQGVLLLL